MKMVFITALLLLTSIIYAQTEIARPSTFKRVYVGVSTTQGVGYRLLNDGRVTYKREPGFEDNTTNRDRLETPSYSTNAGLRIGVYATKFLSFETGVEYSRKGYQANQKNYNYYGFRDMFNGVFIIPDDGYKLKMVYHYIDVPFAITLSVGSRRIKGIISSGLYLNIQMDKRIKSTYSVNGEKLKNVEWGAPYNTVYNVSPFIGVGINYHIGNSLSLNIMPIVQFQAMNNISKKYATKEYLYSGGINVALNFGFVDVTLKPKK